MSRLLLCTTGDNKGVTLIEVIMAVIIAGILVTVALRSASTVSENGRIEETKSELESLAQAIAGNPETEHNGFRNDFGYVGDVGTLPPNLDALETNPGGYSSWRGPYIKKRFNQITNDLTTDAWGSAYTYNGITITSSGSGSDIVKQVATSENDLLRNTVSGNVYDLDGSPPGSVYKDSLVVSLTFPNGSGSYVTQGMYPDIGGFFTFDSIPIGTHSLLLRYLPNSDSLKRYVSVTPGSTVYNEYFMGNNYWYASSGSGGPGGSGLAYVSGTAQTYGGTCNGVQFDIENSSGSSISLTSVAISWSSPTSFYKDASIDGTTIFDNANPRNGSGTLINFSAITIPAGSSVTIDLGGFKQNTTGGPNVDISNTDFTVTFSDGSVITFNSGSC